MNIGTEFDVDALPEGQSFDPIPAGWYSAKIAKADLKETKAGTGKYLNIQYEILGPSYPGRVVFGMITIENPNATAENIGRQNLGDLMRATGIARLRDTDQLIGAACQIKVTVDAGTAQYPDPKNNVKGWKANEGGTMPKPTRQPEPQKPADGPQGNAPPWAKK